MKSVEWSRDDDDGYEMPSAEAMLAGTLALMTGHAESGCGHHKGLMAKKVVSNLFFLSGHPALNPHFRQVVQRMHAHWARIVNPADDAVTRLDVPVPAAGLSASTHWH